MRRPATLAAVVLALALVACGDDEGDTEELASAPGGGDCVEDFNSAAPENLFRLARLSHQPGNELIVGSYDGPELEAETFDDDPFNGDGSKAVIASGACVVTETTDAGTLYLFAAGDDGEWHSFGPTDPALGSFGKQPESSLEDARRVGLSDAEPPEVPTLVP